MAAGQLGADLLLTPGLTISGYTVISRTLGTNKNQELKVNEDGAAKVKITYYAHATVELVLEPEAATSEATITGHFPINGKCTVTGLTAYTVEELTIARSSGPCQVTVRLELDGLS